MHRFYLSPPECVGSELVLGGPEAYHALHVLRLHVGERLTVLDGAGHEILAEVRQVWRQNLGLAVVQKQYHALLPWQITLLQAVPKGKVFECILQKATELGATRIVPLLSERVATQLDEADAARKQAKWRQIVIEAIKQCGQPWLPQVEAPVPLRTYLGRQERFELPLIASLQSDRRPPRQYLADFRAEHQRLPKSLAVWIGPEGDFTPAELNAAKSAGALPISLGRLVLRSETAALYALAVLNYELSAG